MVRITLFALGVLFGLSGPVFAANDAWAKSYELEAKGQYLPAAAALDALANKRPANEFVLLRRGWLLYLGGAFDESIKEYTRAMNLNSKSLDARLGLTLPLLAMQKWDDAALYARQVLEVAPWQYYAHVRLLVCEEAKRDWNTVYRHAQEVAQRYPSDPTLQVYLARAAVNLKKTSEARAAYERVLEQVPGHIEATQYLSRGG